MIDVWPTISIPTTLLNLVLEYIILTRRKATAVHVLVRFGHLALVMVAVFFLRRFSSSGALYGDLLRYAIGLSFIFPCVYLFSESLPQKVFLFFMDWGFTTFLSSFCVWMVGGLGTGAKAYAVVVALYLSVFLLAIPLYIKFWRRGVRRMLFLFEFGDPAYVVLPILTFILFTLLFGPLTPPKSLPAFMVMLLFEFLILFTYHLLFSHFFVVYDRMKTLGDFKTAERQLDLQKRYYEEVDRGLRQQRKLIHDTRHHLTAISALVATGEAASVGPYVDRLLGRYGKRLVKRYCSNTVANAIIGGYIAVAEEKGIAVSTNIDLPRDIGMDTYELCALFGNAIENAIEACQRIPVDSELFRRRFVSIKSKAEHGRLIVRIENSSKDGKNAEGTFPSSKGSFGGVGLESIRAVVERYDGCLNCERMDNVFALSAVLHPRGA